jgi:hypothetical protein
LKFNILLLLTAFPILTKSQDLLVFSDYMNTINQHKVRESRFEVKRVYLGYNYVLNNHFSANAVVDFTKSDYFKYGYLQYKNKKFLIKMGSVENNQLQEWGNRYIMASFQEQYNFAADQYIGGFVRYSLKWLIAEFVAGKGKYGGALTIPINKFRLRGYADNHLISASLNYNSKNFIGCIEGAGTYDSKYKLSGYSFYLIYHLNKTLSFMFRNDELNSNNDGINDKNWTITCKYPWNFKNDGEKFLFGMEISPTKEIRISPNVQMWTPADGMPKDGLIDFHDVLCNIYIIALNLEIKLKYR